MHHDQKHAQHTKLFCLLTLFQDVHLAFVLKMEEKGNSNNTISEKMDTIHLI